MKIILLGAPGSGKGTQAARLSERCKVAHVSTGDILRDEIAKQTELGRQAEDCVKGGRLVPDNLVLNMVFKRLERADCASGFLLDGFPRNSNQAKELDAYLAKKAIKVDHVFYLDASEEELVNRLSGRRYCSGCQVVYNLVTNPPKAELVCDRCGGKLVSRSDDEPTTVRKRLMVYQDLTSPLVAYYKAAESFVRVDASRPMDEVTQQIAGCLEIKKA